MSDSVLAIEYNVWINKTKLGIGKKQCIQSIEICETDEGADNATLTITDPEFLYIEDSIFVEDNPIKIEFGWDISTYRSTFEGYISAIDINFGKDGVPILTVTCMDRTHRMNRKKKNVTYKNCTSAEIVRKIVESYGYNCITESTRSYEFPRKETYTQSNQTDIDFITKLAGDEVYPFTARLIGNNFYYIKSGKLTTPKMTLNYRNYPHEIVSFNPKINKETRQVEIENSSIDTGSKTVSSTTGKTDSKTGSTSSKGGSKNSGYTYNPNTKTWSYKK